MPLSSDEIERLLATAMAMRGMHQELFDEVSGVLYHRDPARIGITTDYHNYEVYDPHTGLVLPALLEATSSEHLAVLIRNEFIRFYGDRETGPIENFKWIAHDIWDAWLKYVDAHGPVSFDLPKPEEAEATVRKATFGDIEELVRLRLALLKEEGELKDDGAEAMTSALREYFSWALPTGGFLGWVAEVDGAIVGTSGLVVFQQPPYPGNLSGKEAQLVNQYTVPDYRRQGIATALIQGMIESARGIGVGRISLNVRPVDEEVYAKAGFLPSGTSNGVAIRELQLLL